MKNIRSGTTFFLFTLMVKGKQLKFCKICISSVESDAYNKKKIQMFVVNMTFISSREVKKFIFHSCLRHSWNIHFFTSLDEIKVIFTPNIWISSIYLGIPSIILVAVVCIYWFKVFFICRALEIFHIHIAPGKSLFFDQIVLGPVVQNVSLKLWSLNMAYMLIFLLKKCE